MENVEEDDDFGDLYADVEIEASSAINAAPHSELLSDQNSNKQIISVLETISYDKEEVILSDYDSDDEDDLDIVLNSDDNDDDSAVLRTNANVRSREMEEGEIDEKVGTESVYKYLKGSGTGAAAYYSWEGNGYGYCQQMGSRTMGSQIGQRFSLPRARNILDVNINIFEHKPWKHPEVDLTDYFNFGFNEDSWKLYCNQMDEYRHTGHISSGTSASEPAQSTETKGQAIQIERGSIFERQSSMDVWCPVDRDSEVIEITILDPDDHLHPSVPEASNHGDVSGDGGTNRLFLSIASEDESIERNPLEMDTYASKRSSSRSSSRKPVSRGSENHEAHQISDRSGGTIEAIRTSTNTNERVVKGTRTIDPSMLVAESFEAETSLPNHLEVSERPDAKREPGERRYHAGDIRFVNNNRDDGDFKRKRHDDSYYSRRLVDKRQPGDPRYHARWNSPVYNSRTHIDFKPKHYHENDDICIRKPDARSKPGENIYHSRVRSPVYNHRTYGVSKIKAHNEDDVSITMSDIEGTYDRHSRFGHNRWSDRLHAFDPYNEATISYPKSEQPSDFYGDRFSECEDWDIFERDLHREDYEKYGSRKDRPVLRRSDDEEYYEERRRYFEDRRRYIEDNRKMARDFLPSQEFGWQNSEYPPYPTYERGAQWKKKDYNLPFRNRGEEDDIFLEREDSDDIDREKSRSRTYEGRERADVAQRYIDHVAYTSWEYSDSGRNNRRVSSPSSEWNNPLLERDDDRYLRYRLDPSFAPQISEESHINNGGSHGNMMTRSSLYRRHGRYREQYTDRFGYNGSLGGYSQPYEKADHTIDIDSHVDMGKTRPHWQSKMLWKEDETMLSHEHGDAEFCAERALFPFEKESIYKMLASDYEPDHVEKSFDDLHVVGHEYKRRRVGTDIDKVERTSDVTYDHIEELTDDPHPKGYRYNQTKIVISGNKSSITYGGSCERRSLSCRKSLDSHLVGGEGKSTLQSSEKHNKAKLMKFDSRPSDKVAKAVGLKSIKDDTGAQVNDINESHNKNEKTGYDDTRILEAMAKIEKRRARFNESVAATVKDSDSTKKLTVANMETRRARFTEPVADGIKDSDSTKKPTVVESVQEAASNKQQRPARKRRWGGS